MLGKRLRLAGAVAVLVLTSAVVPAGAQAPAATVTEAELTAAVDALLDLPYQPDALPAGLDAAFGDADFPDAFPVTDTSTDTCCLGPVPDQPPIADLAPPFPRFPAGFELIELTSFDGTPLHAYAAIEPGAPGAVVMHGFNTNGKHSIVRYAAALRANGYSVIAPDHRDVGREWHRGGSWHPDGRRGQSLGWKESEDLLVAAAALRAGGAPRIGAVGFSEGAQNTILALARDHDHLIDAAITFSPPADQATLLQRNAVQSAALLTTVVNQPDACAYLAEVGTLEEFTATPNGMLRRASAVDALDGLIGTTPVSAPAVHFLAEDDELVPAWNATALASRTNAMPHQATVLVDRGNHAYFYDRWWQQAAILTWFQRWLDPAGTTTAEPTVAAPPLGRPMREHVVDTSAVTRAEGDTQLRSRAACPAVEEPVGPTVLASVTGTDATRTVDLRRSYSGWDDHEIVSWSVDAGSAATGASGTDVASAAVALRFTRSGVHDVAVTVTDDTGRSATEVLAVEVAGDPGVPSGPPAPGVDPSPRRPLPTTGGGAALVAALALTAAAILRRPDRGRPIQP